MTTTTHEPLTPDAAADLLVRIAAGRVLAGDPAAALRLLNAHADRLVPAEAVR